MRHKIYLLFTLLVLLFAGIYKHISRKHNDGLFYVNPADRAQLYMINENCRIHGFSLKTGDSLQINILPQPAAQNWQVECKGVKYELKKCNVPTIKLNEGTYTYTISSANSALKSFQISIEFHDSSQYCWVSYCTLPIVSCKLFPLSDWTYRASAISASDSSDARKIISSQAGINDNEPTLAKAVKLGVFLIKNMRGAIGQRTSDSILKISPLLQYKLACSRKTKVDCAVYSDVYNFFANSMGIPTRQVGAGGSIDKVLITGHAFNEVYIKEQNRWAFVDLLDDKLAVLNDSGKVLNTLDIMDINRLGMYANTKALVFDTLKESVDTAPYVSVNQSELLYLKQNAVIYWFKNFKPEESHSLAEVCREYITTLSHRVFSYPDNLKIYNPDRSILHTLHTFFVIIMIIWVIVTLLMLYFFSVRKRSTSK